MTSPKAGTGGGREHLPKLIERLRASDVLATMTTSIDEMKRRVASASAEKRDNPVVVAAGGDGTLALVADNVTRDVPLVPLPLGTENLLARYFGHTHIAEDVFDTIMNGNSRFIDAGRANGQLFLVMASCGFDAEVVRGLHLRRKGHINRFSYAKPLLRAMRRYQFPELNISFNDSSSDTKCRWAMAFNLPRYGGGLNIEPDAIGDDGMLDVIAFQNGSITSGLRYAAGIAMGRHLRFMDVVRRKARSIEIVSDRPVPYQLDGDYVGRLPLKIETLTDRVQLLVPG